MTSYFDAKAIELRELIQYYDQGLEVVPAVY